MFASQVQFHIHRAGNRICAIRGDRFESELAVHRDGILHHGFHRIQSHTTITDLAGFRHDALGEYTAQTFAANEDWHTLLPQNTWVFLAATLLYAGEKEVTALEVLEDGDSDAFEFANDSIVWRAKRVSTADILASRSRFAISFGSCSFREPIDELANLTRRARSTAQ